MPQQRTFKILYLHNTAQISGGERSLLNLWENLDRQRFQFFLIIPEQGELSREAAVLWVNVSFFKIPQWHPKNCFKILKTAAHLYRFLRDNHIDLIHSYSPRNNILGAVAGKLLGIPVIWHERNIPYLDEPDITKKLLFLPQRIICNSKAVAQRFGPTIPAKVRVVLNGVNLDRFNGPQDEALKEKSSLQEFKTVGMITNLNKRKRIEFLLETIPLIIKKFDRVKFLIVGGEFPDMNGLRLRELQALVKDLGIQDHVVFTGFQDDVRPFLGLIDVFVHVTLKEACSRAIIEAMAMGKPVIAINDGGNPELIDPDKTGILIGPDDKEKLAASIVHLLLDDQKRLDMGTKGRRRAEQLFDVKRNAAETQRIYLELLNRPLS
ncbi:MAG: glycosyltransferase family 4 protein [Candidatus Omnitrophica bacterium]|nr:glycosyltransferase family 4 protein [Candidatus Omnitrophota bacterium]